MLEIKGKCPAKLDNSEKTWKIFEIKNENFDTVC